MRVLKLSMKHARTEALVRLNFTFPDHSSIFTAEACGLFFALKIIQTSNFKNGIIFSDSKSCLEALNSLKTDHPLLVKIMTKLRILENTGYNIQFCWIPGHVGIAGNETADQAAKMGLQKNIQPCPIPHTDLRPLGMAEWDEYPANKLHFIFPSVKYAKPKYLTNRNDQTVFTRCCIGHSRLTNDYHLKGEPPPECIVCNCTLTVKHLLLNCVDVDALRQQFYQVANLPELFKSVSPEKIVGFLKAAGLFNRF